MWARQGWGVLTVLGTVVALVPWMLFEVKAAIASDYCTDASETEQHLWIIPTVLALSLPIAFVMSQSKRSPTAYLVLGTILIGLAAAMTALTWRLAFEPYDCD